MRSKSQNITEQEFLTSLVPNLYNLCNECLRTRDSSPRWLERETRRNPVHHSLARASIHCETKAEKQGRIGNNMKRRERESRHFPFVVHFGVFFFKVHSYSSTFTQSLLLSFCTAWTAKLFSLWLVCRDVRTVYWNVFESVLRVCLCFLPWRPIHINQGQICNGRCATGSDRKQGV